MDALESADKAGKRREAKILTSDSSGEERVRQKRWDGRERTRVRESVLGDRRVSVTGERLPVAPVAARGPRRELR